MAQTAAIADDNKKRVSFDILTNGEIESVPLSWGVPMSMAASICLANQQHPSGVTRTIRGEVEDTLELFWEAASEKDHLWWADKQEAVEYGATGIAVILIYRFTDFTVIERSVKGTGFDYWIGPKSSQLQLFQRKGRLEISGIGNGDDRELKKRVTEKVKQTKVSGPNPTLPS